MSRLPVLDHPTGIASINPLIREKLDMTAGSEGITTTNSKPDLCKNTAMVL